MLHGRVTLFTVFFLVISAVARGQSANDNYTTGCIGVSVSDAVTGQGVQANISIIGLCEGPGCPSPNDPFSAKEYLSDSSGNLIIDAYSTSYQHWRSLIGVGEPLIYLIEAPGYHPVQIARKPQWQLNSGKLYTAVTDVWLAPITDVDTDGDGLFNSQESRFGTSIQKKDTDNDSLSDFIEIYGSLFLDLQGEGANPLKTDIFLECDYYPGRAPSQGAITLVKNAFADAPTSNPDSTTGINLHVNIDQEIATNDVIPVMSIWNDYLSLRAKYFSSFREGAYRYCIFGDRYDDAGNLSSGVAAYDSDRFVVTLTPNASTQAKRDIQMGGTIMHELGHTLGLRHYSPPTNSSSYKGNYQPNYFSVMSYIYQMHGLVKKSARSAPYIDYSRGEVASINENSVTESHGFRSVPLANRFAEMFVAHIYTCTNPNNCQRHTLADSACLLSSPSTAPCGVDFNRDNLFSTQPAAINIDNLATLSTFPKSLNDWDRLNFAGIRSSSTTNRASTHTSIDPLLTVLETLRRSYGQQPQERRATLESIAVDYSRLINTQRIEELTYQSQNLETVTCDNPL